MKTVGKQMQEARLAKNWTPELAARETKIKLERLRDLEADDYTHFTSPTYARGFVRTYARALGLDEYKILRQLDNKLPDDDSSNIVTDSGVAYLPENSMPARVAHRNFAGLYIVLGLGGVVAIVIALVLFEDYRIGEFHFNASTPDNVASATNGAPVNPNGDSTARAMPVDPNTPAPPAVDTSVPTANPTTSGDTPSVRALPVDPSALSGSTNSAPNTDTPVKAVRALPVNPSDLTNAPSAVSTNTSTSPNGVTPPRALPVDPNELAAATPPVNPVPTVVTPAPSTPKPPAPATSISARQSNSGPVIMPPTSPAAPSVMPVANSAALAAATTMATNSAPQPAAGTEKRLILTATQDSFVRVTAVGASDADKPLYAAVLHAGQSVGFDGRKFSINVGIPSAVDIKLDGFNYGPHSDQEAPETFTVESHQP